MDWKQAAAIADQRPIMALRIRLKGKYSRYWLFAKPVAETGRVPHAIVPASGHRRADG
jgi:hypothetical protein